MKRDHLKYLAIILSLSIFGCKESEEIIDEKIIEETVDPTLEQNKIVNDWVYSTMDEIYLWTSSIPSISEIPDTDPSEFFYDLLYTKDDTESDKWSWITEDYLELLDLLSGVTKSYGYELQLYLAQSGSTQVIGFVKYVDDMTPASEQSIERGDMIVQVNGEVLTTTNYVDLLYEAETQYLEFGDIDYDTKIISLNGKSCTMSAAVLQKDPIHIAKTIDINGVKIGYLHYTSFLAAFDSQLNSEVMANFKSEGVKDLVIDLRYNGGGSVTSSTNISSMFLSESLEGEILAIKEWNSLYQSYFESIAAENPAYNSYLYSYVTTTLQSTDDSSPETLNQLDLTNLVVLTTGSTASASELLINNLSPYINVVVVGEVDLDDQEQPISGTAGKFVASTTFYDDSDTPEHSWAIQPIIYQSTNSNLDRDYYWTGFIPTTDNIVVDNFYYKLGEVDEPMLSRAIEIITGVPSSNPSSQRAAKLATESLGPKIVDPHSEKAINRGMYDERANFTK